MQTRNRPYTHQTCVYAYMPYVIERVLECSFLPHKRGSDGCFLEGCQHKFTLVCKPRGVCIGHMVPNVVKRQINSAMHWSIEGSLNITLHMLV